MRSVGPLEAPTGSESLHQAILQFVTFVVSNLTASTLALPHKSRIIIKNVGMLVLAIYLILIGITTRFHVSIGAIVTEVLALIGGVLILVGK